MVKKVISTAGTPLITSDDNKRAIATCVLGVACYELTKTTEDEFEMTHRGIVGREEDAQAWLDGLTPKRLIKVW